MPCRLVVLGFISLTVGHSPSHRKPDRKKSIVILQADRGAGDQRLWRCRIRPSEITRNSTGLLWNRTYIGTVRLLLSVHLSVAWQGRRAKHNVPLQKGQQCCRSKLSVVGGSTGSCLRATICEQLLARSWSGLLMPQRMPSARLLSTPMQPVGTTPFWSGTGRAIFRCAS